MGQSPIARLRDVLGERAVLTGEEIPERNRADATRLPPVRPAALLLPRSTGEVAAALAVCHEAGQPVVTQGGMTGLAAGAHPGQDEIALSLDELAKPIRQYGWIVTASSSMISSRRRACARRWSASATESAESRTWSNSSLENPVSFHGTPVR